MSKHQHKKNGYHPPKAKPVMRVLVVIAGAVIAATAMFGVFNMVKFVTPVDKLIVIASWISIVAYVSYDIRAKIKTWEKDK